MTTRSSESFRRPLEGYKVVEACSYISGPFCAQMLSDLGADVIKVEPPSGDPYRNFGHGWEGVGTVWTNSNRGKRSVVLDLKSPEDLARFKALLSDADIYIENWRPHVSASLGLSFEQLSELNPRIVQLSITGYGPDGDLATEPAFDALIQGRTGLLSYEAAGGTPRATNTFLADKVAAVFAAQMALSGVIARDKSQKAIHLETSMLDIMSYYNFPDMFHNRTFVDDDAAVTLAPQPVLATKDGYLVLSPVTGKQLSRTLDAIGHPEWKDEIKRIANRKEMTHAFFERVAGPLKERTTVEWLARFRELDVPAGPVNEPSAHLDDPQVVHNELYSQLQTPAGTVRAIRYPARFNGHLLKPRQPAPTLGASNGELFED
ncbi:L-carnitine dehydratase/bile acid-inducible protein F [Caballeronia arationis]|jgi:crotonobetainyl-CoA:carnitine CoA-transferase CaiB-like acyl-CoA transferase|uniref:Crotonobetainyl-CoA:carnitine CoA-transferase CaiB n=1 Tax=Caballeronia arationis TaxID=1777142 RepID=A0A7Z7IEB5_9BURK|nr:CoA transferase [Caballeronia arationis]SAK65594.1 L-carnitine dehydratase/bile acid-inducible protein F [Caballeronia arationis]SOE89184.1 Crotonobetainyl-CoA:carnitine CoA-transferase CaiB [Caballeronia arationis]